MQSIIDAAMQYIKTLFADNSDGHGADHSIRVYYNALTIATAECASDRTVISLAALLHDVDDYKLFSTENNANARQFLERQNVEEKKISSICDVINSVSYHKNKGARPSTIEGQIVQDADRLDAIGAIGIARVFSFGGKHGQSLESSVLHFHRKLLLLKDLLNTDKAKEMAQSRQAFMESFLRELDLETTESIRWMQ